MTVNPSGPLPSAAGAAEPSPYGWSRARWPDGSVLWPGGCFRRGHRCGRLHRFGLCRQASPGPRPPPPAGRPHRDAGTGDAGTRHAGMWLPGPRVLPRRPPFRCFPPLPIPPPGGSGREVPCIRGGARAGPLRRPASRRPAPAGQRVPRGLPPVHDVRQPAVPAAGSPTTGSPTRRLPWRGAVQRAQCRSLAPARWQPPPGPAQRKPRGLQLPARWQPPPGPAQRKGPSRTEPA